MSYKNSATVNKKSDFSIEHILTKAGTKNNDNSINNEAYSWLNCTRYCPPKLPRTQKKDVPQKRQLGRHPRIPFSSYQLAVLEEKFQKSPYLSSAEVTKLSHVLNLADIRVKIWFQNRRARERREKQEKEVQQLKPYIQEVKINPEEYFKSDQTNYYCPQNLIKLPNHFENNTLVNNK